MRNLANYEVISVIGTGTFGTCFKVREKITKEIFAWKAMNYDDLSESKKESLFAEINLLSQLKHPNIVEYFDNIINKETKTVFIVMEYCEGGDLSQLITKYKSEHCRFEENYIWRVLYQICKALQVCHNKMSEGSVLHRDIKPANVFLDKNGNVKLGDFGLARILRKNETFADTFVGTPYYMSPELVKGRKYDRKSDIWAVGCLIYEMSALKPPFMGHQFEQLSKNIAEGNFNRIPDVYSSDLCDIISFMLEIDNDIRPNIEIILRNPILVRNISGTSCVFPKLIPHTTNQGLCQKLYFPTFSPNPELSSTTVSGVLSNSTSDMTTINLKKDLLGSMEYNSILKLTTHKLDNSQHEFLYETLTQNNEQVDPDFITRNVFDEALKSRLQSIRAHESLLKQKEADLDLKEKMLAERETRLILKEKLLEEKYKHDTIHPFDYKFKQSKNSNLSKSRKTNDDTYCSIEPNDSFAIPTVAKLNLALMPPPKSFAKKVSFQSPQKFKKYDIENIPPNISSKLHCNSINAPNRHKSDSEDAKKSSKLNLKSSTSSKNSDNSDNSSQKRKSIISSFFGLNIIQKPKQKEVKNENCEVTLDAVESSNFAQIWTSENKKAAFELLAAMNGSSTKNDNNFQKTRRIRSHRSLRIPRQDKRHILL